MLEPHHVGGVEVAMNESEGPCLEFSLESFPVLPQLQRGVHRCDQLRVPFQV